MISDLAKYIEKLEFELQSPAIRRSEQELKKRLSVDFIEIGRSGRRFNLETTLSMLSEEDDTTYIMWDFDMIQLSDDVVQATYKTKINEEGVDDYFAFRSSLWKLEDNVWKMIYHQGTPMHMSEIDK